MIELYEKVALMTVSSEETVSLGQRERRLAKFGENVIASNMTPKSW